MITNYYRMNCDEHNKCCHDSIRAAQQDHVNCLKYHDRNNSSGCTMKEIRDVAVGAGALSCVKWSHLRCSYPYIATYCKSNKICKKWLDQHGYRHNSDEKPDDIDLSALEL